MLIQGSGLHTLCYVNLLNKMSTEELVPSGCIYIQVHDCMKGFQYLSFIFYTKRKEADKIRKQQAQQQSRVDSKASP